jgi:hypothetical protein
VTEVLNWLGIKLGDPISVQLANSTDFNSRVIWPPNLMNRPLFAFSSPRPATWWQRLLNGTHLWPWYNVQELNAELLNELRPRTV